MAARPPSQDDVGWGAGHMPRAPAGSQSLELCRVAGSRRPAADAGGVPGAGACMPFVWLLQRSRGVCVQVPPTLSPLPSGPRNSCREDFWPVTRLLRLLPSPPSPEPSLPLAMPLGSGTLFPSDHGQSL